MSYGTSMKFLFFLNVSPITSLLCGISLILGTQVICLIGIIAEILCLTLININYEATAFYTILVFAIIRCLILLIIVYGSCKRHFMVCYFGNAVNQFLFIINQLMGFILFICICAGTIRLKYKGSYYAVNGVGILSAIIFYVLGFVINLYFCYVIFSMTKELGMGNLDVRVEPTQCNTTTPNTIPYSYNPPTYAQPKVLQTDPCTYEASPPSNINNNAVLDYQCSMRTEVGSRRRSNAIANVSYPAFEDKILLFDPNDIAFAKMSQNTIVNDSTLPSGLKVPPGKEGRVWRIIGTEVILI
jgi:hypothetical protein